MSSNIKVAVFLMSVILACNTHKSKEIKSISIQLLDEFHFRRSYANSQFIKDEVENENYLEEQENTPPSLDDIYYDSTLKKRLESLGVVNGFDLNLTKFQSIDSSSAILFHDSLETIEAVGDPSKPDSLTIIARRGTDSTFIKHENIFSECYYLLSDVKPGGNKEILLLRKHYIMMGDNFDLAIYEIR